MLTKRALLTLFGAVLCLGAFARQSSALAVIQPVAAEKAKELGITVRSQPSANDDLMVIVEFKKQGDMREFRWADMELSRNGKRVISSAIQPRTTDKDTVRLDLYMDPDAVKDTSVTIFVYNEPRSGVGYRLTLKDFLPQK
jgi:hypothetical protein